MRHYCTLFDIHYLTKGLSLYASLQKQSSEDFRLWVLPMSDMARNYLSNHANALPKMVILDSAAFPHETWQLKYTRTWGQFCWTMASHLTRFVMEAVRPDDASVTYLDSDLYFFADPEIAHAEIQGRIVAVVPHRFPLHDYDRLRPAGLYNVSWVTFTQHPKSKAVLDRWCKQVADQCDERTCGDQKYLDEWPTLLGEGLCEFENIGIGPGPWNAYTYNVQPGPTFNGQAVVFYHFHELQRIKGDEYKLTGYPVPPDLKKHIYDPYLRCLKYMQYHIDLDFIPRA